MSSCLFPEPFGQGSLQFAELGLALVLSALIGLEREIRQKSAGLRTYTLVGLASALIMLVSKYGFTDLLAQGRVVLDPSRMAAQIVSGIGFIGGGVIFVRKDLVRGLTTATTIWVTAAVGMACGGGLPLLAVAVTAANFVVVFGFRPLERLLPKSRWAPSSLRVIYEDGRGILRDILTVCTHEEFAVTGVEVERGGGFDRRGKHTGKAPARRRPPPPRGSWRKAATQSPPRSRPSPSRSNCAAAGRSRGSSTSSARSTACSRSTRATRV